MFALATAFTHASTAASAAAELISIVDDRLEAADSVVGGILWATAAAGIQGPEIGQLLTERWPEAMLVGSSFEGVLGEGRSWRDRPAFELLVWTAGPGEPVPLILEPFSCEVSSDELDHLESALREAAPNDAPKAEDLVLLFPDAHSPGELEATLAELTDRLGGVRFAGTAASGPVSSPCLSWVAGESEPGASVGLYLPGGAASGATGERLVRAQGSRFASPWLEISQARDRWIDSIEDESPLDWIRRQLGLGAKERVEPYLDRLLVRVRDRVAGAEAPDLPLDEDLKDFVERYIVGVDPNRGSLSLPGDFQQGGQLAFALPDADLAQASLRRAVEELSPSQLVLQFGCRARDEALHGDDDVEIALVDFGSGTADAIGTVAPLQLAPGLDGRCRIFVHSTLLVAIGPL